MALPAESACRLARNSPGYRHPDPARIAHVLALVYVMTEMADIEKLSVVQSRSKRYEVESCFLSSQPVTEHRGNRSDPRNTQKA